MQNFVAIAALAAYANAVGIQQVQGEIGGDIIGGDFATNGKAYAEAGDTYEFDYENMTKNPLGAATIDDETQPLCAMAGMRGQEDYAWPSDYCCRVYESKDYEGRYFDFCSRDVVDPTHETPTKFRLDNIGWEREISSVKCGSAVAIKMCANKLGDTSTCDLTKQESVGPRTGNRRIHFHDMIKTIYIVPDMGMSATLYSRPQCQGRSVYLTTDESIGGSWHEFNQPHNDLLLNGNTQSASIQEDLVLEVFEDGHFESDSYAVRINTSSRDCHNLGWLPFDGANQAQGISGIHSAWLHRSWFPGVVGKPPAGYNDP